MMLSMLIALLSGIVVGAWSAPVLFILILGLVHRTRVDIQYALAYSVLLGMIFMFSKSFVGFANYWALAISFGISFVYCAMMGLVVLQDKRSRSTV